MRGQFAWVALGLVAVLGVAGCSNGGTKEALSFEVISSAPAEGATDHPIDGNIVITFDDDVLVSSLVATSTTASGTVTLENASMGASGVVNTTVSYDPALKAATITLVSTGQNSTFPNQPFFAFDTPYRLTVSSGVTSTRNQFLDTFVLNFRTVALGIQATASAPAAGFQNALVENTLKVVTPGASPVTRNELVTVALNVDLVAASVDRTTVFLEETAAAGMRLYGDVTYEASTKTVIFALAVPPGGTTGFVNPVGHNTSGAGFAAVPALKFDTQYRLTVSKMVQISPSMQNPSQDLTVTFKTAKLRAPTLPSTGVQSADIAFNEVLQDPAVAPNGDANKDGTQDANNNDDEFVELVNLTDDYLDLSNLQLRENAGQLPVVDFPAAPSPIGVVPPRRALVIFNGPNNAAPNTLTAAQLIALDIGGSKARTATSVQAAFANGGDHLILRTMAGMKFCEYDYGPSPAPNAIVADESATRATDASLTAAFVAHTNGQPAGTPRFSPGKKRNGQQFP